MQGYPDLARNLGKNTTFEGLWGENNRDILKTHSDYQPLIVHKLNFKNKKLFR